jgi:predicted PurR-regulated permease PerM
MSDTTIPSPEATADDIAQLAQVVEDPRTGSWALSGLFVLALLTVLFLARDLVLPVVMAMILSLVFSPAVRAMKRIHIPAPMGAAVVLIGLLLAFVASAYYLAEPASDWIDRAPKSLREIDTKVRSVIGSVRDVATATAQVQDMTQSIANVGAGQKKVQEVVMQGPGLAGTVVGAAKQLMVTAISTLVLLYFLLASGDMFLRKTISVTPRLSDKKRAVDIAHQVEGAVSNYLFTVLLINIALGSAVAVALYFLGVPNPVLWGVMVAVLNFVPYLGDIVSITVLTLVGLLTFDDLGHGMLVPATFWVLTAIEGYLVTPLIVGRRLSLNPVVIVLSVLFWGWMWGIPGALLAVPILIVLKTTCDRVAPLHVFGEYLGD